MDNEWTATSPLAKIVEAAGFTYDPEQQIIYSVMDPWQRKFGYCFAYDLAAPATISAVIDCEPIFFSHANKNWMIELWKGQYGLETGAEIGVYVNPEGGHPLDSTLGRRPHDPDNGRFFNCADNSERLEMTFALKKGDEVLFTRGPKLHWWLTGFKWGVLSQPEELVLDATLKFRDEQMRKTFTEAAEKTGYDNIKVTGNEVNFLFEKPYTHQPRLDPNLRRIVEAANTNNANIVAEYRNANFPSNDPNVISERFARQFGFHDRNFFAKQLIKVMAKGDMPRKDVIKAVEEATRIRFTKLEMAIDRLVDYLKNLFSPS